MHVTDTFAVVNCEAEVAAHYIGFDPAPGQFLLEKPYQTPLSVSKGLIAQEPSTTEGALLADLAAQRPTCSGGALLTPSEQSEPPDTERYNPGSSTGKALEGGPSASAQQRTCPEKRPRKRRKKNCTDSYRADETSLRQAREQEAEGRHTACLPALAAAHSSFQAWLLDSACKTVAEAVARKHRPDVANLEQSSHRALTVNGAGQIAEPASSSQSPATEAVGGYGRSDLEPADPDEGQHSHPKQHCDITAAEDAKDRGGNAGRQPASTRQPARSASSHLPNTSGSGPQAFDLIGLSELRALLKPKFCYLDREGADLVPGDQSWKLFGQVIENPGTKERVALAHDQEVLMPAHSRFLLGDVEQFSRLVPGVVLPNFLLETNMLLHPTQWMLLCTLVAACCYEKAPQEEGFHCVVADPPWENKSASRGQKYPTLPSRRLLSIPVPQMLHKEGGLVALWVTNRERLRRFVEQDLLPAWGLVLLASWFWVKVTDGGELVGPLDITHRKPYEVILLAAPPGWRPARPIPDHFVIFAVPGQHSRKPLLCRLLAPYLPPSPRCLELFARELARGWTSCGNEVLAFQCLRFFRERLPA